MHVLLGSPFREPYDNGRMIAEGLRAAGAKVVQWDTRSGERMPLDSPRCDASIVLKSTLGREAIEALPGYRVALCPDALERSPHLHDGWRLYDRVLSCNDPKPYPWADFFPLGWSETLMKSAVFAAERTIPALFVGTNNSPERLAFVRDLKNRLGASMAIYGHGWPAPLRPKPPAYYADYITLLSKAKVVINRHESPVGPNLKCFEIPRCAPMLVDRARGLSRIFSKDALSAASFDDADHCLRLIERYNFDDDGLAENVRSHQWASTLPYSYEKQMAKLLEELKT